MRSFEREEFDAIDLGGGATELRPEELAQLERTWRLTTHRKVTSFFEYGPGFVKPKNWAGTLAARSVRLHILPHGGSQLPAEERTTLDRYLGEMLRVGLSRSTVELGELQATTGQSHLEETVAAFCDALALARRRRILRRYRSRHDTSRYCRGRLEFPRQLLQEAQRPGSFSGQWVELSQDVPENRFLKAVLDRCLRRVVGPVRRRVEELLVDFEKVPASPRPLDDYRRSRADRLQQDYRDALRMGRQILEGQAGGLYAGSVSSRSEVVVMPDVFEAFVARMVGSVARGKGRSIAVKDGGRYLGMWKNGPKHGKPCFELLPDVEVRAGGEVKPEVIVDAKWKRLGEPERATGVSAADAYQMIAYGSRLGCSRIILMCPCLMKPPAPEARDISVRFGGEELTIRVALVPLLWSSLAAVAADLETSLGLAA